MASKTDAYQAVTDQIVAQLEAGTVPWRKPWSAQGGAISLQTGKPYRGVNQLLLSLAPYASPYWVTYKQAAARDAQVRRGEKSTLVVFWKQIEVKDSDAPNGKRRVPLLRYFRVFNAEQCDGLDLPADDSATRDHTPLEACEKIAAGYRNGPRVEHGGDVACYSPFFDRVQLPVPSAFDSAESYYSTMFHELTHSTGHESRLNRDGIGAGHAFGSAEYSREELVAECGAAMLCGEAGIAPAVLDNASAYIANWLRVLKSDHKLVVQAAARAQRAADHILGIEWGD